MHLYYLLFVVYNALFDGISTQIVCCLVIINRPLGVSLIKLKQSLKYILNQQRLPWSLRKNWSDNSLIQNEALVHQSSFFNFPEI
jgi:hypothetical protein